MVDNEPDLLDSIGRASDSPAGIRRRRTASAPAGQGEGETTMDEEKTISEQELETVTASTAGA